MSNRILLIGGTGTISSSITQLLAQDPSCEVTVMNRGHKEVDENVEQIVCDASSYENMAQALGDRMFDAVIDFIVFTPSQAEDRIRLFHGRTKQYIFISTVVTYNHENTVWLTEDSYQGNKYSEYGKNKQACEDVYRAAYEENGFPVTIVRPSQTYGNDRLPLSVKGKSCWSVISRIQRGKPVIVHGDGKTIWHMMHTFDFAYNFIPLIGNEKAIGKSVNLVNLSCVTWDMIYREIGRQLNQPVRIVHMSSDLLALSKEYDHRASILGDKQYSNLYDDDTLAQLIPDYICRIDYRQGIYMYLKYMDENPQLKIEDEEFDQWCDGVLRSYAEFCRKFKEKF